MLSIRSSADMEEALGSLLDPALRALLTERRDQLVENTGLDLADLVHIVVAQRGDTLAAVEAEAGVPIAEDLPFEWVQRHGRWLEAVVILSDDGFGVALFVPDCVTTDPALLLALLAHA
ncbi:hypothetical protein M9979_13205 [Sphingomonas sp. RP10(2022)]|uniref:Uncharacterized protein n=1 Tax=Sphingomonas liriopis TaxID=2949094 RepID=A0A9X2HTX7_9SPHN|nr:hypothetical protein [Sphingomonas liriopis]MCP3735832.1 hypothetical protein [Sphingomonas liriopis]